MVLYAVLIVLIGFNAGCDKKMKLKKQFNYHGFEAVSDLERDISEIFEFTPFNTILSEFQGTLRVTVEYIDNEQKDEE